MQSRFSKGFTSLAISSPPELFNGRSADHHCHMFGVRQYLQDILDRSQIVDSDRDNGVIGGEIGILNATLVHCREHHWGGGKELLPVPLNKAGRGRADAHDQVERVVWQTAHGDTRRTGSPDLHRSIGRLSAIAQ